MFSKRIIILQFIIIGFNTINVLGQSDKYALLFKSTLEEESPYYDSEFSCEIKYSWRTFSFQYKSTSLNKREPQYDFYYLPDDFTEVNLLFEGKIDYRTHSVPDCFMIPEISIDKTNFNIMPLFGCNFTVIVYPLYVEGTDNTEPVCSTTTLELRGGYDWEYLIGDTVSEDGKELEWKSLSFSTPSINPNIGDIYAIENININDLDVASPKRKIHFRAGHVASGTYVTPITYTVTGCSPQFIGYYDKIKTSCSYFKDGNISLKIDRNLDPSEQLAVTLFKEDNSSGDILIDQYSTEPLSLTEPTVIVLEDLGGGYFGFKWPKDIDAGIYYFRYQTLNDADTPQKPDASDSAFWDKLVKTPNFTIEKATNVDFTAKWVNDESCFEAGDGKVQVEVTSGEIGRSYLYIVYKVEGTTETVERNWTSFSGTTTIIRGLGKGDYKIKVKDNVGCLAK